MSDSIDAIADLATRIAEIRRRLIDLETERTALRSELDDATMRFAAMTTGVSPPTSGSVQMDTEILRLFRYNPDRFFTSFDVQSLLCTRWQIDGSYVRTKLARLAKRGLIRRVGHGRYADKG